MSIGTTIKKLRKEKDLTQEQLAEYLGISAQAISGWECDKSAPDVYQIPVLAHIFKVSADVILGINKDETETGIQRFLKKYDELGRIGKRIEQFDLTEATYKKYPSDFRVVEKYILELFNDPHHPEAPFGEDVHREKILTLCEMVIRDCTIQQIRYTVYEVLSSMYVNSGEINRAKELCSYFPSSYFDVESEQLEQLFCRTDRGMYIAQMRENIMNVTDHLVNKLRNLSTFGITDPMKRIAVYSKCIEILHVIYDDENAGFMLYHKGHIYSLIARCLFELNDSQAGVQYMQKGLEYCLKYDLQQRNTKQTVSHHAMVVEGVCEDLSKVYTTTADSRVAYEMKAFNSMAERMPMPQAFFEIMTHFSKHINFTSSV